MATNSTEKPQTLLYAKLMDGQLVTTCVPDDDHETLAMIVADGFKPYDDSAEQPTVGEFQEAVATYNENAKQITLKWKVVKNSPEKIAAEIARLQSELAATDYQVIKSYEYEMTGKKSPYDISTIHADRQAVRDRIGELEEFL